MPLALCRPSWRNKGGTPRIEAVQQWRFDPAKKDGQPFAVMTRIELDFRLY
jgi:hypothetical protein